MKTPIYPLTPKQSRAWFVSNGIPIKDWCEALGLDRYIVTDLLRGRLKGQRGEAHLAAIKLGLKADPDQTESAAATAASAERRADKDRRGTARGIEQVAA